MKNLNEAVHDRLKDLADNSYTEHGEDLDSDTYDSIRNAFGDKHDHTIIDLKGHDAQPDIDVKEHLEKHGYQIHDYKKGTARITKQVGNPAMGIPMRSKEIHESIGKVLEKTSAPAHVKNAFANDDARQSSKSHGLKVLISTHPYATIGKTSGTKWENESCMNAETGSNRHYLERDQAHATHEAFLVHPDDDCVTKGEAWPSNPIARVSLKRHVGEDEDTGDEHSIYRAGGNTYGAGNSDFHRTVENWAIKNYPGKRGTTYRLHDDLYNEGTDTYHNPTEEELDKIHIGHNRYNYTLSSADIHHAINKGFEAANGGKLPAAHAINLGVGIQNMDTHNVNKIINDSDNPTQVAGALAKHHGEKFSTNNIERYRAHLAQTGQTSYVHNILVNKKLPDHIIDNLSEEDTAKVPHQRLKEHHVDKLVDGYLARKSSSHYWINDATKALSSKHIDKLINYRHPNSDDIHPAALRSDKFTQDHAEEMVKHYHDISESSRTIHATDSKYVSPDYIQTTHDAINVLDNDSPHVGEAQKAATKMLVKNAASKVDGFGRKYSFSKIPIHENILKHVSDDDFKTLMNNGRFQNTKSKAISNKLLDMHKDEVDHELTKFHKKYDGEESPENHQDFEGDREKVQDKLNDHQYLLEKHAEDHGDEAGTERHMEKYDDMTEKHRTGPTASTISPHISMDLDKWSIRDHLARHTPN